MNYIIRLRKFLMRKFISRKFFKNANFPIYGIIMTWLYIVCTNKGARDVPRGAAFIGGVCDSVFGDEWKW